MLPVSYSDSAVEEVIQLQRILELSKRFSVMSDPKEIYHELEHAFMNFNGLMDVSETRIAVFRKNTSWEQYEDILEELATYEE